MSYCYFCKQDVEFPCSTNPEVLTLAGLCACEQFKKSKPLIPCVDPLEIELDFFNLENTPACIFCGVDFPNDELADHHCRGRDRALDTLVALEERVEGAHKRSPLLVADPLRPLSCADIFCGEEIDFSLLFQK